MDWLGLGRRVGLALMLSCAVVACSEENPDGDQEGAELPDAVEVLVGKMGGTVKAKGVTLTIPVGALDKEVTISAKVLDNDKHPALPKDTAQLSPVYEFGPKGTKFNRPVLVQIDTEKDEPAGKMFFTKENDETQFEQLASVSTDKKVSAQTKHFSLAFAGIPPDSQGGEDGGAGNDELDSGMDEPDVEMDASSGLEDGGTNPRLDSGSEPDDQSDASTGTNDGGSTGTPDASTGDGGGTGTPDAGVTLGSVVVRSFDLDGLPANQTWAAYKDGADDWVAISAEQTGIYKFDITSEAYAFAYVCAGAESDAHLVYAVKSHNLLDITQTDKCHQGANPAPALMSGNVTTPDYVVTFGYGMAYATGFNATPNSPTTQSYGIPNFQSGVATDLFLAAKDENGYPLSMMFLRDVTVNATANQDLDFSTDGFLPGTAVAEVSNSTTASLAVEYNVGGAKNGVGIRTSSPTAGAGIVTMDVATVPGPYKAPSDRYHVIGTDTSTPPHKREAELYTTDEQALVVAVPPQFDVSLSVDTSAAHFAPRMIFTDVPGVTLYTMTMRWGEAATFTMEVDPGVFPTESSHELIFPDLTAIDGYETSYSPFSYASTTAAAVSKMTNATSTLLKTSSFFAPLSWD